MHEMLADDLCARVNCRNVGAWLSGLAEEWGVSPSELLPQPPVARHEFLLPGRGLRLVLSHPHAGNTEVGDLDRWLMTEVHFQVGTVAVKGWDGLLPLGLDAQNETPSSAITKLNGEPVGLGAAALARDDRRQSFFLDDALVLEISWCPSLQGIEKVTVIRLGAELISPPWSENS